MAKQKFERTKPHVNIGTIGSALKAYPDAAKASSYAKDALAFCAEHNILESDRTELRPGEAICRCEVAQMVWNLLAAAGEV